MKLIVQIPCLNEEATIQETVAAIPRQIPGIDIIEILVIDDGCTDKTVEVSRQAGVDHILSLTWNHGLARAFRAGMDHCIKLGADIIVSTDGDGQYAGEDILLLVEPIIQKQADIVIGDRQTRHIREFGLTKRLLQRLGSYMVSTLSNISVPDAVSGFRALSKGAALQLNILSEFSYTIEMIIQAGNKQLRVVSVPVRTNNKTRKSRLYKNTPHFVIKQMVTMARMFVMYRPLRFFFFISALLSILGAVPVIRFLVNYFSGDGAGNIQSLIIGGVLLTAGFVFFVTGLLSDLISQNRQLSELSLSKIRELELQFLSAMKSNNTAPGTDRD